MAAITADGRQELVALFLTMFGRAPTTIELAAAVTARENGSTLAQVATELATKPEFALLASKDADSFVSYLADALLAADTPAVARDFATNWALTQLQGTMTKAQLVAKAIQELRATTNVNYASAQAELTADVTVALTVIDNPIVPAKNLALTTGLDTGAAFTGGTNDDSFSGVSSNDATVATITAGDSLDGGMGTDKLTWVVSGTSATVATISTKNIETLAVTNNNSAGATTFDASLMNGLATFEVTAGAQDSTLNGGSSLVNVSLTSTGKNTTVTPLASVIAGTADAVTVTLNGAATANSTLTYNGVETFNVVTTGAASGTRTAGAATTEQTLTSDKLEKIVVTGTAAANLKTAVFPGTTTQTQVGEFDASGNTGSVYLNMTGTPSSVAGTKITMTGADDSVTIGTLNKNVTIAGGLGNDVLNTSSVSYDSTATTQSAGNVSGFETLGATATATFDLRSFANNKFTAATSSAGTLTVNKANAELATVSLTGATGSLVHTMSTDGSADALTVKVGNATAAATNASVSVADVETLTIDSSGFATNTITALTAADLTKLVVTGSKGLIITDSLSDTSLLTSVDASANTGAAFTLNSSFSSKAQTVKGSLGTPAAAGDTVNTITTGTGADSVTGGDYADTITTGGGADTVVSAAGNDTIDVGNGNDSVVAGDGNDTITSGAGDDTIDAGAGNDNLYVASLSDNDSIDGGAGSADLIRGSSTSTSYTAVSASAAPTIAGVESGRIQITTDGSYKTAALLFDMTKVTGMTSLTMDISDTGSDELVSVKNYGGTTLVLSDTTASGGLTLDGTGQDLSVTLDALASQTNFTVTGVGALTLSARSINSTTSVDQDSATGAIVASTATAITLSTTGSAATNADALVVASLSAADTGAITLSAGANDELEITGAVTVGNSAVRSVSITGGLNSTVNLDGDLNLGSSTLDTMTVTLGEDANLFDNAANGDLAVTAASISALTITIGANADADLSFVSTITSGTVSIASGGTFGWGAINASGKDQKLSFSGAGSLDSATVTVTAVKNLDLNFSGLTTTTAQNFTVDATAATGTVKITGDNGNDTLTGAGLNDTLSGGLGTDALVGAAGNDSLTGGEGTDSFTGGTGNDVFVLTETTAAADTVNYAAATAVTFAQTASWATFAAATDITGADVITGAGNTDILDFADDIIAADGAITVGTTALAANTAGRAILTGTYDATAKTFIAGASSSTANDYLVQWGDGTRVQSIVLQDLYSTTTTVTFTGTAATDIITIGVA